MSAFGALQILLADDNQHMRAITATILNSAGFRRIREVRDGAEAMDALRDWPADLAIVDFNMAPLDGVEFTRMIRNSADSPNPYLPVIMMTGHSEKSRVVEARDAPLQVPHPVRLGGLEPADGRPHAARVAPGEAHREGDLEALEHGSAGSVG